MGAPSRTGRPAAPAEPASAAVAAEATKFLRVYAMSPILSPQGFRNQITMELELTFRTGGTQMVPIGGRLPLGGYMRQPCQHLSLALLLACFALRLTMSLPAQDFRAKFTDQSGAAIAGAKVRVIQRTTNEVKEGETNHEGYYALPYLQPSTYDIEVS